MKIKIGVLLIQQAIHCRYIEYEIYVYTQAYFIVATG